MAVEQRRGAVSGNALTRKVGPLPVWGWAVGLLLAYFLYQRYKGSSAANASSTQGTSSDTTGGADMNPVPVGVAQNDSGLGAGFGGGQGTTTINNYYGSNPADTGGTGTGSNPPPQTTTGGEPPPGVSPGPITTVPIRLPSGWPGTQSGGGQPSAPPPGVSVPLTSSSSGFVPASALVRVAPGTAKAV